MYPLLTPNGAFAIPNTLVTSPKPSRVCHLPPELPDGPSFWLLTPLAFAGGLLRLTQAR